MVRTYKPRPEPDATSLREAQDAIGRLEDTLAKKKARELGEKLDGKLGSIKLKGMRPVRGVSRAQKAFTIDVVTLVAIDEWAKQLGVAAGRVLDEVFAKLGSPEDL